MLGLGLAAYGYSSTLKLRSSIGLWHLLAGVAIVTVIRPHIAVTLAASMTLAYLWGLTHARQASIFAKFTMVVVLIAMFAFLASVARGFSGCRMFPPTACKNTADEVGGERIWRVGCRGSGGAGRGRNAPCFPPWVVRVLFQPFPWEIQSFNTGLAAVENLLILWFDPSHARRLRSCSAEWFESHMFCFHLSLRARYY